MISHVGRDDTSDHLQKNMHKVIFKAAASSTKVKKRGKTIPVTGRESP
jgi:hypothetical protein